MECQFALSLGLYKLAEVLCSAIARELDLENNAHKDIQSTESWLKTMSAFLYDHDEDRSSHIIQDQFQQIQTFAYDIVDTIDEFKFQVPEKSTKPGKDAIQKMCSKIKRIKGKMEAFWKLNSLRTHISNNTNTTEDSNSATGPIPKDGVVGFECEAKEITSQLLSMEPQQSLISIVGPPGSGKTALAYHLYESEGVRSHFHHRAWVSLSHPLNRQKVLQTILMQLSDCMDKSNLSDEDAILEALKRLPHETGCLVVLDGLWSKEGCDRIMNAISKVSRLSRIIVTSQISDIASSCLLKYELKALPLEKASTLLCKKAFQTSNGKCPPELEAWTEKIVKKCEGLPLSLVAAGNLLSNKRPNPYEWKKVHDGLGAQLPIIRSRILPSYKDLPGHLRFCLLYFSVFPENYCIQRERLKRLWMAEGFVNNERNRTKEDVAEDYLDELAQRNLIHVCARDIDGRVKRCRLLNLVHQFIVSKAEEGNFVKILTEASSEDPLGNVRRLSVQSDTELSNLNLNLIRSAFLLQKSTAPFPSKFRLLTVLEMEGAPLESFPTVVLKLALLTYLSLRKTNIRSVPDSIKNLQRLETLDLRQTHLSCLPKEMFKLHCLRHLLVSCVDVSGHVRSDGVQGVEIFSRLTSIFDSELPKPDYWKGPFDSAMKSLFDWPNIQTLSLVKGNYMLLAKLGDFTKLRKLGLVVLKQEDGRKICESIQKMEHLSTLEIMMENEGDYLELDHIPSQPVFTNLQRLCLRGRLRELPRWICQLPSLIKISLKWSRLKGCPLQPLQTLPNLMQLELVDAFHGNSLEFKADTFPKLKVLHIQQLDELRMLVLGENAILKLEKLKMSRCGKLKAQSCGMSKLAHLEELHLHDMPQDFIGQVVKIINECGMMTRIHISHSDARGSIPQQSSPETQA